MRSRRFGSSRSNATRTSYAGPALKGSTAYAWTIATTDQNGCASAPANGLFVTAAAFENASFVWTKNADDGFAYFRGDVSAKGEVARATLYASALTDDFVSCGYFCRAELPSRRGRVAGGRDVDIQCRHVTR